MRLILFGGKGGVGKTTCASATAVQLAGTGQRTLLLSTDPAHSLSDSFETEVGPEIRKIKEVANLSALEISAEKLFLKFKEEHGDDIKEVLETGTYLDEDDVENLFSLSIPGLDEVMFFIELVDIMEKGEYDRYIVDTCPTGHALRFLALPELLDGWIKILAQVRYKYRLVVSRLAKKEIHESSDDFLFSMKKAVKKIHELLRDPTQCEFVVVAIPEVMALSESRRLVKELQRRNIPVNRMIVNHLTASEGGTCQFCREKGQEQRHVLQDYKKAFPDVTIFPILDCPYQVKGFQKLREFGVPIDWFSEVRNGRPSAVKGTGNGDRKETIGSSLAAGR